MKRLLILATIIMINYTARAQEYSLPGPNDYYHPGEQITVDGITFKVSSITGYDISLSNVNNWRENSNLKYLDGTEVEGDLFGVHYKMTNDPTDSIIVNTFTRAEYNKLKAATPKQKLLVHMSFGNDGNILEVSFGISPFYKKLLQLPPEKYALLEKNFKKFTKVCIEEEYKRLQFINAFTIMRFTEEYPPNPNWDEPINTGRPSIPSKHQ